MHYTTQFGVTNSKILILEIEKEGSIPRCLKITEIVSFNIASKRATFTFRVDKNSVTRQVNFNRTKIDGKCQNSKIQMRHFG